MKSLLLTLCFFTLTLSLTAQSFSPSVQEVINAEISFASLSKEKNTREAFLNHLGDSAIVFAQGNPVNGKDLWTKRKADNSLLFWWPVFSDVSASGDFGYNTGPFEISKDRTSKPFVFGYFSSVWKKDSDNGVWKVAIDMGMVLPSVNTLAEKLTTSTKKPVRDKESNAGEAKQNLMKFDNEYITHLNKEGISFLPSFFAEESRLHHTGHFPVISQKAITGFKDSQEKFSFQQLGGDIASSADLAFVYGRVNAINKSDQKPATFNYLRIWKKEDGKYWKIVLDVIGG